MLGISTRRVTAIPYLHRCQNKQQQRLASLIRRPKRPYTFTQLVTLSDGSTYTHRTTSPAPVFRSQKDTRNTPLWNPSSQRLQNVEADEAGKLKAFRERYGRGYDAQNLAKDDESSAAEDSELQESEDEGSLMDLLGSFDQDAGGSGSPVASAVDKKKGESKR